MKSQNKWNVCAIAVSLIVLTSVNATAQTLAGWRGPQRDGVYEEKGLQKTWSATGPTIVWSAEDAGKGYSSPVGYGDRIFVTGMDEEGKNEILSAYSLDGKKVYQVTYGTAWNQSFPDTRTTPTVVNDKVYVISGSGEVVCLQAADGKILWKVDGNKQFHLVTDVWGVSESPLVFDNKVIFSSGGNQTSMVALHATSGETLWTSPALKDTCSHVSPILITYNGIRQIIGFTANYLYGVNPETGAMMWTFNDWAFTPDEGQMSGICSNTPIYKDGKLFVSNGYDMRGHMLELKPDLSGVTVLWRNNDLGVHTGGMVLVNGVIYGGNFLDNSKGNWAAVDWNTGKTCYKIDWPDHSKGSIIAADGMLYCYEERRGEVALVKPNPGQFEIVSQFRLNKGTGGHWAHPTIHNGMLVIRHGSAVMAYRIKE